MAEGFLLGTCVDLRLSFADGLRLLFDADVGLRLGFTDGLRLGLAVGIFVRTVEGFLLGICVGFRLYLANGFDDGLRLGTADRLYTCWNGGKLTTWFR